MTERIVVGPCLTRAQAARRAGVSTDEVRHRPDLLRLGGRWLEETYLAFQFNDTGVRRDVGAVVLALKGRFADEEIADWLVRPNVALEHYSPLAWLRSRHQLAALAVAVRDAGPVADAAVVTADVGPLPPPWVPPPVPRARRGWRRPGGVAPVH